MWTNTRRRPSLLRSEIEIKEIKEEMEQKVEILVKEIETALTSGGRPKPEHVSIVTEIGSKYVSPGCSSASDPAWWGGKRGDPNFGEPGPCQLCKKHVASEGHGLHCCNRGHWCCWSCMVKGIDWRKVMADPAQRELLRTRINSNLQIDANAAIHRDQGR